MENKSLSLDSSNEIMELAIEALRGLSETAAVSIVNHEGLEINRQVMDGSGRDVVGKALRRAKRAKTTGEPTKTSGVSALGLGGVPVYNENSLVGAVGIGAPEGGLDGKAIRGIAEDAIRGAGFQICKV